MSLSDTCDPLSSLILIGWLTCIDIIRSYYNNDNQCTISNNPGMYTCTFLGSQNQPFRQVNCHSVTGIYSHHLLFCWYFSTCQVLCFDLNCKNDSHASWSITPNQKFRIQSIRTSNKSIVFNKVDKKNLCLTQLNFHQIKQTLKSSNKLMGTF